MVEWVCFKDGGGVEMAALKIFHSLLNEPVGNDGQNIVRDYFDEKSIEAIELNIDFFEGIPQEDLKDILETVLHILYEYLCEVRRDDDLSTLNLLSLSKQDKPTKYEILKPTQKIKKVLIVLKNYQSMVENCFGTIGKDGKCNFINPPKELYANYKNNQKIIDDLEKKEFKLISKYKFYKLKKADKTMMKHFLKDIRKKYNLKTSLHEKELIDQIGTD